MVFREFLYFLIFDRNFKIETQMKSSKNSSQIETKNSYKKTVAFDPSKSETYRALHEDHFGGNVHEIPITVQHQTYQPNRGAPVSPKYCHSPHAPRTLNVNIFLFIFLSA